MAFFGREAELGRLDALVAELAAGRGGAVLVEGEPGIGKSALLHATAERAAVRGCTVFWGAGEELGEPFPLLPLLAAFGVHDAAADSRRRDVLDALQGSGSADAGVAAAEHLLALIDELTTRTAALLVVDDLHWADATTVSVCHRLARSVIQRPLLLVGALRPLPRRDDLQALRRAVGRAGQLRLGPLPPEAVAALVAQMAGGLPGPGLAKLADEASGNPLYVTELVDALARADRLVVTRGAVEAATGPAPRTLTEAITDRLAFLSAATRTALQAVALLGADFAVDDLVAVLDLPADAVIHALVEARDAGVLVDEGERLAFRHPLIRAALYDQLPPAERASWHLRAARALHDAGAGPERVARQLRPARAAMDAWAIDWLRDTASQLLAQAAPAAVDLLDAAIHQLPSGDHRRASLASRLGLGLVRQRRAAEAERLVEDTLPLAVDPEDFTLLHLVLADARVQAGRPEAALGGLETGLRRADLGPRQRARLAARSARLYGLLERTDAADAAAGEALTCLAHDDDPEVRAHALLALTTRPASAGDEQGALALIARAQAALDGHPGLVDLQLAVQISMALQLIVMDQAAEAERVLRRAQQLADRSGNRTRFTAAQVWLTCLYFETGRWDEAIAETPPAAGLTPYERCQIDGAMAVIAAHRGPTAANRRHVSATTVQVDYAGQVFGYLWLARALERERAGFPIEALAGLRDAAGDLQETEVFLADAVRLAVAVGDQDAAGELTARAKALPAQANVPHRAGIVLHCRGLLHSDPSVLLHAAERYAAAHRPLPRAQALEAAAALLAAGGDVDAARPPFTTAAQLYAALGARWDITRMRDRFRPWGLRVTKAATAPKTGWAALTPAEAKVAAQVAEGRSNPDIAERLLISRRTVEVHVARILAKLELRSRIDLVRLAADAAGRPPG